MTKPFSGLSIRGKMTLAALAPLLLVLLLVTAAAFYLINAWIVDEAQKRVRRHLHAAREVLWQEERHLSEILQLSARSPALTAALAAGDRRWLEHELPALREREGLDLLTLADPVGHIVLRGANPGQDAGEPAPASVAGILAAEPACGMVLIDEEELLREGETLAARARIPLRSPLPIGRRPVETRGLFLVCSTPVTAPGGPPIGHLYGGRMLNGNLPLVDRIREIIYGGESHHGMDSGSATLFLGDLRVATTVRLPDGERAIGTRVSTQVAEAVLGNRSIWVDRARVVDEWYLTAYGPILDPGQQVIGALYVGLLERPYADLKTKAALLLLGLLGIGGGVGYLLARTAANHLSRPILRLEAMANRVAEGERQIRLPVTTGDEVGHLTETFNRMTASLCEREEDLSRLNRELELKVAERTAALEERSGQLIRAQEDLARSERLAAVGSLAAGVAHEINNPAAIIRGNSELLLLGLPAHAPEREEVAVILKQTDRIARITQGMLSLAREDREAADAVQVNTILADIVAQIAHQVPLGRVCIHSDFAFNLPPLPGNPERLRQVFTNLILNALQAMAGEGALTVRTCSTGKGVEIAISDTGSGIPREIREKIFDPFFTTKSSGTGLGLSISYAIIQAYGGAIEVESQIGQGSTFRVWLPLGGR